MADRTVRTIFEAVTSKAQKNLTDLGKDAQDAGKKTDELAKDLKTLDGLSASPDVDVKIDEAERELADLKLKLVDLKGMDASPEVDVEIEETERKIRDVRSSLNELKNSKIEARLDLATKDAEKRLAEIKAELGELRTMEATPEVRADIQAAQKNLREVQAELRELRGAKAQLTVTADTSNVESELSELGDVGDDVGDDIGGNMVSGIIDALGTIPIAGAVVGVGAAIAGGLILGIQQGLAIEAERDLFSARTGLDEQTAARFGRAAGEAYANAWGDSVAANLETARIALEQGLLDEDAIDAEVQGVIESLSGISDIMQADIPAAARAAGQMIKTGLADSADEAFDVLIAGFQNGADASQDLLDTFEEYSVFFKDLGLSAQDATGLLIQGLDAGAFNADKVADALKELTIKVKELDDTAGPALEELGLDGKAMSDAFAAGGPVARDALDQILTALADVEDPADRARLAVGLFGTQAEDMASSINSLNLDTAADQLGGIEGAAGAAERALATMGDNAATQIEGAKRNIEIAADGIKGALAAAFADDIDAAAKWVQANRAPLLDFFLDVINGAFEMGKGFLEFSAMSLEAIAGLIDGLDKLLLSIQPVGELLGIPVGEIRSNLAGVADAMRETGETMRGDWTDRLSEMQSKANEWAAPEIMKARVHDATVVMTSDLDTFLANVNTSDGTVTINGNQIPAEEVLDVLVENIDASDGTVTINGDKVPADKALDTLLTLINSSREDVTIGAVDQPGRSTLGGLLEDIGGSRKDVTIGGNDAPGRSTLGGLMKDINSRRGTVAVDADTARAEQDISRLTRYRVVNVGVRVTGGTLLSGSHEGGWVKGLNDGGWVPGRDPGYDNVLWPLNSGGRTLQQPLAGGEYVVNSRDASYWALALEAINSGYRPSSQAGGGTMRIEGVLDTPFGPSQVRGVVRSELDKVGRTLGGY